MAALTAGYDPKRKDGQLTSVPLGAGKKVYKGALVATLNGYAQAGGDVAGTVFAGVAAETVDNTAGAAGAQSVRVYRTGVFLYNKAGAVQADVGKACLLVDDNTVSTAATTNNIAAGFVSELVSGTQVRVRIDRSVA